MSAGLLPSRRACSALLAALALSVLGASARAEDANHYGARGRTIVSGSLSGFRSNLKLPDSLGHDHRWSVGGKLTLAHFWWRNFALGGTVVGGISDYSFDEPFNGKTSWFGADVDAVAHLPLTHHLSLRFWLWIGLRGSSTRGYTHQYVLGSEERSLYEGKRLIFRPGAGLDMLVHLSPSVALTFGPSFAALVPVAGGGAFDFSLSGGPGMTYSFGPGEDGSSGGSQLEDARHFGARGRTVLAVWSSFTLSNQQDETLVDLGYVRFLAQGIGLGAYVVGNLHDLTHADDSYAAGGGMQVMGDVPLGRSVSLLLAPRLGYMWKEVHDSASNYEPTISNGAVMFAPAFTRVAHELQVSVPAYLALHLRDGLVLGVGPELVAHIRMGGSGPGTADYRYVRGGVSSTIAASF